jgi:hypothetical protein
MASHNKKTRREDKVDLPVSDEAAIFETTVFPTIEAIWLECIVDKPFIEVSTFESKQIYKWIAYTIAAELLRLVAFRMNADQDTRVFDDIGKEILAYDRALQAMAHAYNSVNANGHGH